MLMLEHALTEYYVSICFVNLLYSVDLLKGESLNQTCKYSSPEN